jgi:hypothetical protein
LRAEIKELKNEKQLSEKLQKENQDLNNRYDKVVTDKDEEISCLKNHNQSLVA